MEPDERVGRERGPSVQRIVGGVGKLGRMGELRCVGKLGRVGEFGGMGKLGCMGQFSSVGKLGGLGLQR